MELQVTTENGSKKYKLKFNLLSRCKMIKYGGEEKLIDGAYKTDRESLYKFIFCCLDQNDISFEKFQSLYPQTIETDIAIIGVFRKLIENATNPYGIPKKELDTEERERKEIDYKHIIISVMSKGYTQKQTMDMTYWDINLILESDKLKLERETFHTNAIINYIAAAAGYKGKPINLLGETNPKIKEYQQLSAVIKKAKENKK